MIKRNFLSMVSSMALASMAFFSCGSPQTGETGLRTDALDESAWESSVWISAADADVVDVKVPDDRWHAASGASWFVSVQKNEGKVVSAKWMKACRQGIPQARFYPL